jgi:hypothetical protein
VRRASWVLSRDCVYETAAESLTELSETFMLIAVLKMNGSCSVFVHIGYNGLSLFINELH